MDASVKPRLGLCFQYDRSGGVSFRYSDSAIYITQAHRMPTALCERRVEQRWLWLLGRAEFWTCSCFQRRRTRNASRSRSCLVAQRLPIFLLQTVDGLVANSAHRRAATDITRYRSAGGAICPLIRVIRWFGDFSGTLGWSVYDNAFYQPQRKIGALPDRKYSDCIRSGV